MTNKLIRFRSSFLSGTLDLLWAHWSDLGVLGQTTSSARWIVDPEALLAATVQFGRYDPRLFDAAIGWCLLNGRWLNSTRVQRLQKDLSPDGQRVLAAIASLMLEKDKSPKWRRLVSAGDETQAGAISLFLLPDGKPLPQVGRPDAKFLRFGLRRPPLETRRTSVEIPMKGTAALQLRLRAFVGVASRAEILLYLVTHRRAHPRLVARQTHYTHPPIARAMAEMALSGVLREDRTGREVEYELEGALWRRLFHLPKDIRWINWDRAFSALRRIWACTGALEGRNATPSILGSELSRCAGQVHAILRDSEVRAVFAEAGAGSPERFPEVFFKNALALLDRCRHP